MRGPSRAFPVFVLAASAAVLGAALFSQYWGGLAPCELCVMQRWPWMAAIVIAFVAAMVGDRRGLTWVALLLAVVFVVSSSLAFYHVGVERHWFAGPTACTASGAAPDTIEALRAQLLGRQAVRCDEPAWSLWGITLAGWNLIASVVMTLVCAAVFQGSWRRRGR
jgi:disulfide bond formation protein DsbB